MGLSFIIGVSVVIFSVLGCVKCQTERPKQDVDLCSQRPNVHPNGEHLDRVGQSLTVYVEWNLTAAEQGVRQNRCLMRFSTCSHCRIRVKPLDNFHYPNCDGIKRFQTYDGVCYPGCIYLHLYDRDYFNQTAETFTSSSQFTDGGGVQKLDFQSESRYLYVVACANQTRSLTSISFRLNISAEEKLQVFQATSSDTGVSQTLRSPFFPEHYVLNSETYTYVFKALTQDGYITMIFDDWHLYRNSSLKFDKASTVGEVKGIHPRPWIISDGPQLRMTFDTGPYIAPGTLRAYTGFQATFVFHVTGRDEVTHVNTNCGGWIEKETHGELTFNPSSNGSPYYDCVWVLKPPHPFQQISIQVLAYAAQKWSLASSGETNLLEIRRGSTSQGLLVQSALALSRSSHQDQTTEQVFSRLSGDSFYIRIKGHYPGRRDFVLSYTAYFYGDCSRLYLYKCRNLRCISRGLDCNGLDNCGDNSDEKAACGAGSPSTQSSGLSVTVVIPVVVSVFLLVVVVLLVVFIVRCRRLAKHARPSHRHPRQSAATDQGPGARRRHNGRQSEGDDGVLYDPPPSYEDVLSNTPIGCLNLGFSEVSYSPSSPVEPPSYAEATSPAALNAAYGFPGGADDTTDSSFTSATDRHPSPSSSSDDSHHPPLHASSSTSSSTSSSQSLLGQRSESGAGVGRHPSSTNREGKAVGVDPPVASSRDLNRSKQGKDNNDKKVGQGSWESHPALVKLSGEERGGNGLNFSPAVCRIESSPIVSAPQEDQSCGRIESSLVTSAPYEQNSPAVLSKSGFQEPGRQGQSQAFPGHDSFGSPSRQSSSSSPGFSGDISGSSTNQRHDNRDYPLSPRDSSASRDYPPSNADDRLDEASNRERPSDRKYRPLSPDSSSSAHPQRRFPPHCRKNKNWNQAKHFSRSMENLAYHAPETLTSDLTPASKLLSRSLHSLHPASGQVSDFSLRKDASHHRSQPLVGQPSVENDFDRRSTGHGDQQGGGGKVGLLPANRDSEGYSFNRSHFPPNADGSEPNKDCYPSNRHHSSNGNYPPSNADHYPRNRDYPSNSQYHQNKDHPSYADNPPSNRDYHPSNREYASSGKRPEPRPRKLRQDCPSSSLGNGSRDRSLERREQNSEHGLHQRPGRWDPELYSRPDQRSNRSSEQGVNHRANQKPDPRIDRKQDPQSEKRPSPGEKQRPAPRPKERTHVKRKATPGQNEASRPLNPNGNTQTRNVLASSQSEEVSPSCREESQKASSLYTAPAMPEHPGVTITGSNRPGSYLEPQAAHRHSAYPGPVLRLQTEDEKGQDDFYV